MCYFETFYFNEIPQKLEYFVGVKSCLVLQSQVKIIALFALFCALCLNKWKGRNTFEDAINARRAAYSLTEPCFCGASTYFFSGPETILLLSVLGYMLHIDPVGVLDFSFFFALLSEFILEWQSTQFTNPAWLFEKSTFKKAVAILWNSGRKFYSMG